VAQRFDLVDITNTVGCPISRVLCEKWDLEIHAKIKAAISATFDVTDS
jgi:hypothetical protein